MRCVGVIGSLCNASLHEESLGKGYPLSNHSRKLLGNAILRVCSTTAFSSEMLFYFIEIGEICNRVKKIHVDSHFERR